MKLPVLMLLAVLSAQAYAQTITGGCNRPMDPFQFEITKYIKPYNNDIHYINTNKNSNESIIFCDSENRIKYRTSNGEYLDFTFDHEEKCDITLACTKKLSGNANVTGIIVEVDRTSKKILRVNFPKDCEMDPWH